MKRTPEIFEKIEGYLANTLSQEDVLTFEKELSTNPELQQEVEKHKALHDILSDQDTLDFKEKLVRISRDIDTEKTSTSTGIFSSYWKVAATIIVLLGIGSFMWYSSTTRNKTQDLYGAYYEPFPVEDMVRGDSITGVQHIMKYYTSGSYDSVVVALEKYPDLEKQQELQLYLGNSYLNTDQEKKAIAQFKEVENKGTYYEAAQWYLSLTYLKLNKPKKATALLKEIIAYNGAYQDKAMRLLKALKK